MVLFYMYEVLANGMEYIENENLARFCEMIAFCVNVLINCKCKYSIDDNRCGLQASKDFRLAPNEHTPI